MAELAAALDGWVGEPGNDTCFSKAWSDYYSVGPSFTPAKTLTTPLHDGSSNYVFQRGVSERAVELSMSRGQSPTVF